MGCAARHWSAAGGAARYDCFGGSAIHVLGLWGLIFGNGSPTSAAAAGGDANTLYFTATLSATTRTWATADFVDRKLPVQLDGVSVTIDNKPAYVYYISPSHVDVIVPADSATGPAAVVVSNNSVAGSSVAVALQTTAPALFAAGMYAVATHADGSLVGPATLLPGAIGRTTVPIAFAGLSSAGRNQLNVTIPHLPPAPPAS